MNSNGDVINSLERKLMQAKDQYRKDYAAFKERLDAMKKKDSSTIASSQGEEQEGGSEHTFLPCVS